LKNRRQFMRLSLEARLNEFDTQINAIRTGLNEIVPLNFLLPLYTPEELERQICGSPDFDVELLKSVTVYEGDILPHDRHVLSFWKVLEEFTPAQKEQFLRFTWARTRLPHTVSEFGGNTFKLKPSAFTSNVADSGLPKSATCFFSLQLPPYSSVEVLKEKLLYAFQNTPSMDRDLKLQNNELYNYEADDL